MGGALSRAGQSARGLAQSKTLSRVIGRQKFPPGFGVRRPSGAFEMGRNP